MAAAAADNNKPWIYEPSYLIEYDLPAAQQDDTTEIEERSDRDMTFRCLLFSNPKIGNPFFVRVNHALHKRPPQVAKWTWSDTPEAVRKQILAALLNHGRVAIMQKERFQNKVGFIGTLDERKRVLKECNVLLWRAFWLLEPFSELDEECNVLQWDVEDAWKEEVDLDKVSPHIIEHSDAEMMSCD